MAEYIDKRDAIDIFKQFKKRKWISMPIEQVIEIISVVPYVEVEPIKHGYWIHDGHHIRCSNCEVYFCGEDREGDLIPNSYCPNCGSIMDEVEE